MLESAARELGSWKRDQSEALAEKVARYFVEAPSVAAFQVL